MDDVGGPVVAVADAGARGGQQVEQVVVRRADYLGGQGGGEVDDAGVVTQLGGEGPYGGPGVDVGVQIQRLSAPSVEGQSHRGPVPAGQVSQTLVGEHVQGLVGPDEAVLGKGAEDLVYPAQGYATHQPCQLLTGAQGPRRPRGRRCRPIRLPR